MNSESPIILFDGICNLCNGSVQFVIRHDKKKQFKFTSLQSVRGQQLTRSEGKDPTSHNSFILIKSGNYYYRSTAALKVLLMLGGIWRSFYLFIIIPRFIRDAVYNFIAQNRYRIFGKKNECILPNDELRDRFLK
ncbi:MAG: thiol-disulfide oxidoreductase DCC family protein [Phycisphaerales bacterium]|nr:thiol-disulfide oxidoreductase DCC family protein [Phycisphaerales bacterium]